MGQVRWLLPLSSLLIGCKTNVDFGMLGMRARAIEKLLHWECVPTGSLWEYSKRKEKKTGI